uniref:Uncharacterized protein n=1 Tax=Myoviridae sp. ctLjW1 TaxID=2825084 RepID=A0A8S5PPR6_9CAUD|nr:MAG TPA: hypothetical protein [Myoviridae sp. ctLjW1]
MQGLRQQPVSYRRNNMDLSGPWMNCHCQKNRLYC